MSVSCGQGAQEVSDVFGVRDNGSVTLVKANLIEGSHPTIPGSELYFALMLGKTVDQGIELRGYPIDCQGSNMEVLAKAFGFDHTRPRVIDADYASIRDDYKLEEQPILRCSSVAPNVSNQSIRTVFQLVKDDKKYDELPDIFVRFNRVKAGDFSTNENKFYSVGCRDFLETFGTESQKNLANAVPILASTAQTLFADFEQFTPLNCMNNTADILEGWSVKYVDQLPERNNEPILDESLELHSVNDSSRGNPYLLIGSQQKTLIDCPGVTPAELLQAFGLQGKGLSGTLEANNPDYQAARRSPVLECRSPINIKGFDRKFTTIRGKPNRNLYRLAKTKTYFEFGCNGLEKYFTEGKIFGGPDVAITDETADFLKTAAGIKYVQVACYLKPKLTREQIIQEFRDAFARDPFSNEIDHWTAECKKFDSPCSKDFLRSELVKTTESNVDSTKRVIQAAFRGVPGFPGALSREPFAEELEYFLAQSRNHGPQRAHYTELKSFLGQARFLDRAGLAQALRNNFGSDDFPDWIQFWTNRQFEETSKTFGIDDFIEWAESNSGNWETVARRAFASLSLNVSHDEQLGILKDARQGNDYHKGMMFNDFVEILKKHSRECVDVPANLSSYGPYYWKYAHFMREHSKIVSVDGWWRVGTWEKLNQWSGGFGLSGLDPKDYPRRQNNWNMAALIFVPWNKNSNDWSWDYHAPYRNQQVNLPETSLVAFTVNDSIDGLSDNVGQLSVCVE
jgi:hypothetical protein